MAETAMGDTDAPSPNRPRRDFPSFVREPGVRLPPPQRGGTTVPTEEAALAALKRYRAHPTEEDERTVHAWINAAKDDPDEYARRVRLTAPR